MISLTKDEIMVQEMNPDEDLHGLDKKRICFSLDQLKFTLEFSSNKNKKKAFLDFCQQMLIKKEFKSLDFYDVERLFIQLLELNILKSLIFYVIQSLLRKLNFL